MSFRDFSLPRVQQDFALSLDATKRLFPHVEPIALSETMRRYLEDFQPLGMSIPTEKGRSELLIAPLLAEVWRRSEHRISLYSGVELNVDEAAGLNGVCDFLLGLSPQLYYVEAPVVAVVEAKKDSIPEGLGQCAAQMVALQTFNQKAGKPYDPIYGCVTTGALWRFLRLSGKRLEIDLDEYQLAQADRILGVLLYCCRAGSA